MISYHALVVFATLCLKDGIAQLSVAFPLNSQLPPVAIVNQAFSFTFSPNTFSTQSSSIGYELTRAPIWLHLNVKTRTLFGTPSAEDVGDLQIEIEASESGGMATAVATLVVIEHNTVSGNQDMLMQRLRDTGSISTPSTLILRPSVYFDLNLGNKIFHGVGDNTKYYAVSADNTPLPAWISFNPGRVSFSGTTPSLLTPQASPQAYTFAVAASQVVGFSQFTLMFSISVVNHDLAFAQPFQQISISAGDPVYVPPLFDLLRRDNQPVARSAIASISSNQPTWLTLNTRDISFSGLSPKDLRDTLFRVSVVDDENNFASADVRLLSPGQPNERPSELYLGTVNGTAGEYFNYSLPHLTGGVSDEQYDVELGSVGSWLTFVRSNLTLQGLVPPGTREGPLNISVFIFDNGDIVHAAQLTIMIIGAHSTSTLSASQSDGWITSSTGATAGATPPVEASLHNTGSRKKALALIIAIPLLSVFAICLAVYFLLKRSRKKHDQGFMRSDELQQANRSPSSRSLVVLAQRQTQFGTEEMTKRGSPAPRIDLPWTKHVKPRVRQVTNAADEIVEGSETRSSWDEILLDLEDSHISLDSSKLAAMAIVDESYRDIHELQRNIDLAATSPITYLASPPPPRHVGSSSAFRQYAQAPRFNGRRTSGLGHGTALRNQKLGPNKTTLLQLPGLPILGKQRLMSRAYGSKWATLPTQRSDFRVGKVLYQANAEENNVQSRRIGSPTSSGSIYEDEDEDDTVSRYPTSSSGGRCHNPRSGPVDDNVDDWVTEKSMAIVGSKSARSQVSEQSQSHSLRFI